MSSSLETTAIARLIPSNWCDPILTGPTAALHGLPWECPEIEALLTMVRERIEKHIMHEAI